MALETLSTHTRIARRNLLFVATLILISTYAEILLNHNIKVPFFESATIEPGQYIPLLAIFIIYLTISFSLYFCGDIIVRSYSPAENTYLNIFTQEKDIHVKTYIKTINEMTLPHGSRRVIPNMDDSALEILQIYSLSEEKRHHWAERIFHNALNQNPENINWTNAFFDTFYHRVGELMDNKNITNIKTLKQDSSIKEFLKDNGPGFQAQMKETIYKINRSKPKVLIIFKIFLIYVYEGGFPIIYGMIALVYMLSAGMGVEALCETCMNT